MPVAVAGRGRKTSQFLLPHLPLVARMRKLDILCRVTLRNIRAKSGLFWTSFRGTSFLSQRPVGTNFKVLNLVKIVGPGLDPDRLELEPKAARQTQTLAMIVTCGRGSLRRRVQSRGIVYLDSHTWDRCANWDSVSRNVAELARKFSAFSQLI